MSEFCNFFFTIAGVLFKTKIRVKQKYIPGDGIYKLRDGTGGKS